MPLWAAIVLVLGAAPVLDAAYPDRGWWPLLFPALALHLIALIGRRFWSGALVGFVGLGAFYLLHIEWASTFLGPVPMVGLALAMAIGGGVGGGLLALAYRWVPQQWPSLAGRLVVLPVTVAGVWTAREAVASVFPYGGFAWGRLSQALVDAPVSPLYAWVGVSGLSFLVVLLTALAIEAVRVTGLPWFARVAAPVGLAAAMLAWPAWPTPTTGELSVAMVQGDGPAGYFDHRTAGDLLAAQVAATRPLYGTADVDLVLWPEGSSDWDPMTDAMTARVWDEVSRRMGAPLLAQAVTARDDRYYNTAILWKAGEGALDLYDKRHPVPMGEYVPDRAFFAAIVPDLIGLIQRDYTPGSTDAVMDVDGTLVAVNICYDIVDDALLRESVLDGGRVILASSNNADFGYTDESAQQLAFARIRAIELGRTVANVSTVGITAVIAADGSIVASLPWYTAGTIVADLPLIDTITPAAAAGRQIEVGFAATGIAFLILAGALVAVDRRTSRRDR